MAEPIRIHTPFTAEDSKKLHIGDSVLITGEIYAARDAAHKKMTEALAAGEKLPIDWHDKMVYYLGPTPAKPGDPIGSCGPTTSGRMDAYTPTMLDQGIKGMIGKGSRTQAVVDSMKKWCHVLRRCRWRCGLYRQIRQEVRGYRLSGARS
jgi:fumarate hydratase subunit beta